MKRAIVLQHMDRESPGLIAAELVERGAEVKTIRLDQGEAVPTSERDADLWVVMGGSMGVEDIGDARYPFLAAEVELLRKIVAAGTPVLAVCLGAQLLAHAAGAAVAPMTEVGPDGRRQRRREVGFGTVKLLGRERDPAFAELPETLPVVHWHGDAFQIPGGAIHLASSDICATQAFRLGAQAYGLQFHVELDDRLLRRWASEDGDFVRAALGPDGPALIVNEAPRKLPEVNKAGKHLVGNIVRTMLRST